jgi:peptidoglycan/LPS O-acetylase OafA/YrhL
MIRDIALDLSLLCGVAAISYGLYLIHLSVALIFLGTALAAGALWLGMRRRHGSG